MKKTKYPIHPDFKFWAKFRPPLSKKTLPMMKKLMGMLYFLQPAGKGLALRRLTKKETGQNMLLWKPKGAKGKLPCLVYFHGGGYVFPPAPYHYRLARTYAREANCAILFVRYRLAPKHPFPAAPEDCFSAYAWLLQNADGLMVDPNRVAVGGDSAGGCLAAAVCLMAEDKGVQLPCGQMLVYPVAGKDTQTESMQLYTDTPMCSSRDMDFYGACYVPEPSAGAEKYRSPIDAPSLAKMPPAYIETAQYDCLRDGALLFGERLEREGVPVQVHQTRGTMHGFDIAAKSPIVKAAVQTRLDFLKNCFQ